MNVGRTPPELRDLVSVPAFLGERPGLAHPIEGVDPSGRPVSFGLAGRLTLLVFVSTSCEGCRDLWAAFASGCSPLPRGIDAIVITKGPTVEAPSEVAVLSGRTPVVMADAPWVDYAVHAGPFFVVVDGASGRVATEGVAWSVAQIQSAVRAVMSG